LRLSILLPICLTLQDLLSLSTLECCMRWNILVVGSVIFPVHRVVWTKFIVWLLRLQIPSRVHQGTLAALRYVRLPHQPWRGFSH
jgi:hypothetical protein